MQTHYLTKSDFKAAQTCPTKLYYRKMRYPTTKDGDEYLDQLRDQGYLIEALVRTLYPDGQAIGYSQDVEAAARETMAALSDPCILFEATFVSGGKLARVDILVRHGDVFELIEIKSKAFNRQENDVRIQSGRSNVFCMEKNPEILRSEWRSELEDIAFQTIVLQEVFPSARVIPTLIMPDSSRPCASDGLHHQFVKHSFEANNPPSTGLIHDIHELQGNSLLASVNVAHEVGLILPEVHRRSETFLASLNPSLQRIHTTPSSNCRECEYRVTEGELRGFHECWREMADTKPHILELYRLSEAGGRKSRIGDQLIAEGKAGLFDIPVEMLVRQDGNIGEVAQRQRIQINHTRENKEWVNEQLGPILESLVHPLNFIDFETCTPAIPRYERMRPYEAIAFQWSCQTISSPGDTLQSGAWLQSADSFPNIAFAEALRRQTGDEGSILIWSLHEKKILTTIRQ